MLAHGTILHQQFYSAEQLTAIAGDFTTAGLAPADMAVMAFAEKLARDEAGRAKAARPNCA